MSIFLCRYKESRIIIHKIISPINRKLLGTFTSQAELTGTGTLLRRVCSRYAVSPVCRVQAPSFVWYKDSLKAVQYLSIAKLNYKQGSIFIVRIRGEEKAGAILLLHKKDLSLTAQVFIYTSIIQF